MKKNLLASLLTGLFVFGLASAVNATPIYFTDRTAFDAATGGGLNFESFEGSWSPGASISFSGFNVSETGGGIGNQIYSALTYSINEVITDGSDAIFYQDNGSSVGSFFSFTSPINAFGLDVTTNVNSTVTIGGSVSDSIILSMNTPSFWGVIEMAGITSVTFNASGTPLIGFDAVSYGAVPEPTTMLLLGTGLVGVAGAARRRKKKQA